MTQRDKVNIARGNRARLANTRFIHIVPKSLKIELLLVEYTPDPVLGRISVSYWSYCSVYIRCGVIN